MMSRVLSAVLVEWQKTRVERDIVQIPGRIEVSPEGAQACPYWQFDADHPPETPPYHIQHNDLDDAYRTAHDLFCRLFVVKGSSGIGKEACDRAFREWVKLMTNLSAEHTDRLNQFRYEYNKLKLKDPRWVVYIGYLDQRRWK